MDFKILLKELKKHSLPVDKFAISSSGVLAVRNIREANDLDLVVTTDLWEILSKTNTVIKNPNRPLIQLSENVSVLGDAYTNGFDLYTNDNLVSMSEIIEGVRYVPLEIVSIMKKRSGREKDLIDIDLINEYLKKA